MKRGDVFWADIPHINESTLSGKRPVIILSSEIASRTSASVIVVPCTRTMKRVDLPCHVYLSQGSYAHCENVMTISKKDILEKMYTLNVHQMKEVEVAILTQLGFIGG